MTTLLLASVLVMLASLAGVFVVWQRAGTFIEKNLHFLISFSAGVFSVIAIRLTLETIEHTGSVWGGLLWVVGGAFVLWGIFALMPALHHHHDGDHRVHTINPRRLMTTDGLHNIGDGIVLAASFAVSVPVGIATTVSIFVHELLQEIAEFFVLRQAGYSTVRALIVNFLVSGTVLVGAVGGYFLLETFEGLHLALLGVGAGGIFVVVLNDLIPHSLQDSTSSKHYAVHLVWFVVGVSMMYGLTLLLPHEDSHEQGEEMHMAALSQ